MGSVGRWILRLSVAISALVGTSGLSDEIVDYLWKASMGGTADVVLWNLGRQLSETDNGGFSYSNETFNFFIDKVKDVHESFGYHLTEAWLHEALTRYPIEGMHVLIVGSTSPVYESFALNYNAEKVTVVEYGPRSSSRGDVEYVTPQQLPQLGRRYDACISVSSVEHDGMFRVPLLLLLLLSRRPRLRHTYSIAPNTFAYV